MNKKMSKRQKDIKSKLMAAICMLLVSSIMMVSTTYAWFTLSTAPEVTGISTAVGANGNLEMALQPYSGDLDDIESEEGDSLKNDFARNITWGNLVNVSDNTSYGMNNIVLYPAKLNAPDNIIAASPLSTPKYGADGRVSEVAANTITGAYDPGKQQFAESMTYDDVSYTAANGAKGVRAIGVASSMSPRELAHRNALASAISEKNGANADAGRTLNTNGSAIGNIAVKHGLGNDGAGYTATEIQPLKDAVNDLDAIANRIEKSLKNYLLANSIAPASTEATYVDIMTNINNAASLAAAEQVTGAIVPTDDAYIDAKEKLEDLKDNITIAKGINDLTGDNISWDDLSQRLVVLVNMDEITVQGMKLADIQKPADGTYKDPETNEPIDGKSELINRVSDNGLVAEIVMPTGSGVFADIADFTGNYSASFKMRVAYGSVSINANAEMYVRTTENPTYLDAVSALNSIKYVSASGTSSAQPITTFYGYIIDLAFRTNAAGSNLQLQSEAVDRIYTDGTNTNTMGHGATMSFKTDSTTFGQAGVKDLMENIRVIFFDTSDKTIIGYARLDKAAATNDGDNVVMPLVMTDEDGVAKTKTVTVDGETKTVADSTIMALEQNVAQDLSVMVYLDGENMTNADIAADQAKSMYGSMNLQFSSSAELEPMNYADLMTDTGSGNDSTPVVSDVTTGTVTEGYAATINHVAVGTTYNLVAVVTETTGNTAIDGNFNGTVKIGDANATYTKVGTLSGWVVATNEATAPTTAVNVTVTPGN